MRSEDKNNWRLFTGFWLPAISATFALVGCQDRETNQPARELAAESETFVQQAQQSATAAELYGAQAQASSAEAELFQERAQESSAKAQNFEELALQGAAESETYAQQALQSALEAEQANKQAGELVSKLRATIDEIIARKVELDKIAPPNPGVEGRSSNDASDKPAN